MRQSNTHIARKASTRDKVGADLQATRIVGAVMAGAGGLLLLPELLMLLDGGISLRLTACSLTIAVPLLVSGVRRLAKPDIFQNDAHRDLD